MFRKFGKLSKLAIACAIAAGSFAWSFSDTTHALSKLTMDKALQDDIRYELGLPEKEPVTEDEISIIHSLSLDDTEEIQSLKGLEHALYLTQIFIMNTHDKLDITALSSIESLQFLYIDSGSLNEEGQYVVEQLKEKGVTVVTKIDLDDNSESSSLAPIKIYIDGELAEFGIDPVIVKGSTMVQFRPLFEQFGLEVGWDGATRTVTGSKEKLELKLVIDSKSAFVSGQPVTLPSAPILMSGNTMVPLRFIGEATGRSVEWDAETRTVSINSTVTSYNFEYLYSNDTKYFGDQKDGVPNGKGRLLYKGTLFYEGDFNNGIVEGNGIMYDVEDTTSYYDGPFLNNRPQGEGKMVYSGGSYYEGSFVDGMREGIGKWFNADGSLRYNGQFKRDALHGHGTYYEAPRNYYIGSFERGYYNGSGKFYTDGKLDYDGEWLNDGRYIGKQYYDGKLGYVGYFYHNEAHDSGTVYSDGSTKYYRGELTNGNITGVGIFYLEDGIRYIGEVYEGNMDGYGFIRHADNTISNAGYWVADEYIGEEPPPVTEDTTIKQLLRNSFYSYIDGYYVNDYNLDSTEAMMFIELETEEDAELFNGLSKEAKAKLMNHVAQMRWGDVVGVEQCYVYVTYDYEDIYARAAITYEQADADVVVEAFAKGNGKYYK
ncbi:hypothetical protein B1748_14600 [Paenibacillus sp. MY03]|uniref:stalk domain-containing protein n=1 Tax=Paenibacillus sp. MY03 TaxID=302980 RepID=UPI000B3CB18C|nr:stalk domain-containing protein [Paenibacillus sp. MY03]OUS76038.1 hypothetical protein B1748_14600 [Paenibacillus sp. MY03]